MSEEGRARPYMDWQQVILNGGPPCFAVLDGEETWYCGRAQRWVGHDGEHKFISLDDLISAAERRGRDERDSDLRKRLTAAINKEANGHVRDGLLRAFHLIDDAAIRSNQ